MNEAEILWVVSLFVGCLIRCFAPYIRKYLHGEVDEFQEKYLIVFLVSYIVSWFAAATLFLANPVPVGDELRVFLSGLLLGAGSFTVIAEFMKWFGLAES